MERELVDRARAGDRDAFDALVRPRVGTMYHTALAILGHPADADDATQEAFIAAWRRLDGLRDLDSFDGWLTRILVNACRSAIRRRTRRRVRELAMAPAPGAGLASGAGRSELVGEGWLDQVAMSAPRFDEAAADTDRFDRAFERLSVDERFLLVLHHLEGRPLAEIGLRLGIPPGTVKSRLHRARAALEAALAETTR